MYVGESIWSDVEVDILSFDISEFEKTLILIQLQVELEPWANHTIVSYNASAVKIYNVVAWSIL
jgi:hypothetical protein